ncbi:hypothetical protein [Skermania piniformis]|uniref:PIN domain-containing protein n=1 Tax=Skermania pinensis TaxID=39122 RepID=A0ABX8S7W8_9ACTN|nr:hypothetical protein [Skermania piniformis]QXQ13928.1 hypothetical protein KV203_00110 [Skermania piniformis]
MIYVGCVFAAPALVDFAAGTSIYVRARVRAAIADQGTIVLPAAVLQAAWQTAPESAHHVLDRLPTMEVFHVDDLDGVIAKQAGLLGVTTSLSVDQAQAAWSALVRGWPLLTTDGGVYAAIRGLTIESLP